MFQTPLVFDKSIDGVWNIRSGLFGRFFSYRTLFRNADCFYFNQNFFCCNPFHNNLVKDFGLNTKSFAQTSRKFFGIREHIFVKLDGGGNFVELFFQFVARNRAEVAINKLSVGK